ncbi:hypothetical protein ACFW2V_37840 [Streptomyces sp. NPDC058947]|uniref:hypothetical protein n=1 Tax=Streptomyces sp. NPDC058947 TaxID=3346675 RepID=UPI0036C86A85
MSATPSTTRIPDTVFTYCQAHTTMAPLKPTASAMPANSGAGILFLGAGASFSGALLVFFSVWVLAATSFTVFRVAWAPNNESSAANLIASNQRNSWQRFSPLSITHSSARYDWYSSER